MVSCREKFEQPAQQSPFVFPIGAIVARRRQGIRSNVDAVFEHAQVVLD